MLIATGEMGIYYEDLYPLVKPLHNVRCLLLHTFQTLTVA